MSPRDRPLAGLRIVVTRPDAAEGLIGRLEGLGAVAPWVPATRLVDVPDAAADAALADLARHDWLAVTSARAVEALRRRRVALGHGEALPGGMRVMAVGTATADALAAAGWPADVVPRDHGAAGLVEALASRDDVRGRAVLFPSAEGAAPTLAEGLAALGASCTRVVLYRSAPDPAQAAVLAAEARHADGVTLMAGSAVGAWVAAVGPALARRVPAFSVGPSTTAALRAAGLSAAGEASPSTAEGLAAAVARYFTRA